MPIYLLIKKVMKSIFFILFSTLILEPCLAQSGSIAIVKKDTLHINLGDKLFFQVETNPENKLSFRQIESVSDSSRTVSIELTYTEGAGTMLKIFNPFAKMLIYKAELYSYKKKEFVATSTVPVYPGISSFETWPYKINLIQLSGFKLTEK
jgi:hypothetical protein